MLVEYLKVFLVGGLICLIGQILIIKTKMTSARILVTFLLSGMFLEMIGVYDFIVDFGKAGCKTGRYVWRRQTKSAAFGTVARHYEAATG